MGYRDLSKVDWSKWPPWRKYEKSATIIELIALGIAFSLIIGISVGIVITILL